MLRKQNADFFPVRSKQTVGEMPQDCLPCPQAFPRCSCTHSPCSLHILFRLLRCSLSAPCILSLHSPYTLSSRNTAFMSSTTLRAPLYSVLPHSSCSLHTIHARHTLPFCAPHALFMLPALPMLLACSLGAPHTLHSPPLVSLCAPPYSGLIPGVPPLEASLCDPWPVHLRCLGR